MYNEDMSLLRDRLYGDVDADLKRPIRSGRSYLWMELTGPLGGAPV